MSETIHLDSAYSVYSQPTNDPFDAKYYLSTPISNASRIYLRSIEMPCNFANIRSSGTLNKIMITTNLNNTYTVSIAQSNYLTIDSLISALNNAFVGVIPSTVVTFAYSGTRVSVSAVSSTITSFSLVDTTLSKYVLGFRNNVYSGLVANATVDFLLNVDNYVVMYLRNVPCDNTSNNGRINCSFKIPMNAVSGMILFNAEGSTLTQFIRVMDSNNYLSYLHVQIYDRFDELILVNNADYSFTLGIQYKNIKHLNNERFGDFFGDITIE